jgi:hypothetical protein
MFFGKPSFFEEECDATSRPPPRKKLRSLSPPRTALDAWQQRLKEVARRRKGGTKVWILNAKGYVSDFLVGGADDIKDLMWAGTAQELSDYRSASKYVFDCDHCLLNTGGGRSVYMVWKPMALSKDKNINIIAARILLENYLVEPPTIDRHGMLTDYFECLPSDHVVLCSSRGNQLSEYSFEELMRDWPFLFPQSAPMCKKPASVPFRRLIKERYPDGAIQALGDYEQTGAHSQTVRGIIQSYLRLPVGPASHWDRAQVAVLTAACALQFERDWKDATRQPRYTAIVLGP